MTKKEWLYRATEARETIARLEECIALEREEYERITARYSDMPGGGSRDPHKFDRYAIKISDYLRQIGKCKAVIAERKRAILRIKKKSLRDVLRLRYLDALPWSRVAEEMNYSESNIFFLHREALKALRIPAATGKEQGAKKNSEIIVPPGVK